MQREKEESTEEKIKLAEITKHSYLKKGKAKENTDKQ